MKKLFMNVFYHLSYISIIWVRCLLICHWKLPISNLITQKWNKTSFWEGPCCCLYSYWFHGFYELLLWSLYCLPCVSIKDSVSWHNQIKSLRGLSTSQLVIGLMCKDESGFDPQKPRKYFKPRIITSIIIQGLGSGDSWILWAPWSAWLT